MSESDEGGLPQALIIRPGETEYDRNGIVQGTLDVPLNADGLIEVERIKDLLWGSPLPTAIYSSSTEPGPQTANAIGEDLRIPVTELAGLRNIDFGLWQGMRWTELWRQHPRLQKCWTECPEAVRPPGGEPITEAVARAARCLKRPLKRGLTFAVVVPEPLASIVRSIVMGGPLSLAVPDRKAVVPLVEAVPLRPQAARARLLGAQ